mgnify:FL=1
MGAIRIAEATNLTGELERASEIPFFMGNGGGFLM